MVSYQKKTEKKDFVRADVDEKHITLEPKRDGEPFYDYLQ